MRFLLDENLERVVAQAASVMGETHGDFFLHLADIDALGTKDPEIPGIARDHDVDCLVTANVRDFGARKFYFEALLAQDLHVCVLRPTGKQKFNGPKQISLFMQD